jgi:predicted RNA-binding Zn-ribbon protein involved in translation (DUF1610 family)
MGATFKTKDQQLKVLLMGLLFILLGVWVKGFLLTTIFIVLGVLLVMGSIQWRKRRKQQPAGHRKSMASPNLKKVENVPVPKPTFIPVCPYCKAELKNRKPPQRCSTFACPVCGESIYENPQQFLYLSMYLTREQAGYAGFLWQLNHWVGARGSYSDYVQMEKTLSNKFGIKPDIGDVIWGLMNLSVQDCHRKKQREFQEAIKLGFSKKEAEKRAGTSDSELEKLTDLMAKFRTAMKRSV